MLPYLLTNDDTIIIQLSSGPKFVYLYSFNYWKIKKNIETLTEDEILELLKTPPLPDGIRRLHVIKNKLFLIHIQDTSESSYILDGGMFRNTTADVAGTPGSKFLGVFATTDDIKDAFPEYFI